jgi:hypothetical protein
MAFSKATVEEQFVTQLESRFRGLVSSKPKGMSLRRDYTAQKRNRTVRLEHDWGSKRTQL